MKNSKFSKQNPKKLGQMHEMNEKGGLGPLPSEEKLDLGQKNPWGWSLEWERDVLEGEKSREIKRDRVKWGLNHADPIYRSLVILNKSRGIERCRALKGSTDAAIEQVSLGVHSKKEARWIEELSRSCRDCDKKKLKSSIDKPGIEGCQEAVKIVLKTVFQRKEKHRHECNQTCNSTKDPNNILSFQNHLSTGKILST